MDQYPKSIAADRQPQNGPAGPDALTGGRQQARADDIVAMARRHADEIRATAEQEAHSLLRAAETRAASLEREHLAAHRDALDRLAAVNGDIESSLKAAVAALGKARGLSNGSERTETTPPSESVISAQSVLEEPQPDAPTRYRALTWIGIGCWCALMLSVVVISMRPVSLDGSGADEALTEPPAVTAAEALAPSSPARNVPAPSSPARNVSIPSDGGLTITFVANRECWISTAVDGGTPRSRLLKPSETFVLHAREELTVKVGNAAALSLAINDLPAAPLGSDGEVITRRITRANYRTLLAIASDRETITAVQAQ